MVYPGRLPRFFYVSLFDVYEILPHRFCVGDERKEREDYDRGWRTPQDLPSRGERGTLAAIGSWGGSFCVIEEMGFTDTYTDTKFLWWQRPVKFIWWVRDPVIRV